MSAIIRCWSRCARFPFGSEVDCLEDIPHLRGHFAHPVLVRNGVFQKPQDVGQRSDLRG